MGSPAAYNPPDNYNYDLDNDVKYTYQRDKHLPYTYKDKADPQERLIARLAQAVRAFGACF